MKAQASSKRKQRIMTAAGGVFGILLAYAFISRAFSTGSYWQYFLFIVFMILGVKLLVRTFKYSYEKARSSR